MKIIFFLFFFSFFNYLNGQLADCKQSVLDLVIAVDSSASIGVNNFKLAKNAIHKLVSNLNIGPSKAKVGIINYSYFVESVSSLIDSDQNKNMILNKITNLAYLQQATATGDALNMANVIFNRFRRTSTPRVLLIFTDGFTNFGSNAITASENLKKSFVSIFSIGIGNGININELVAIADKPSSKYVKLVSDYSELVDSINAITLQTCMTPAFIVRNQRINLIIGQNETKFFQLNLEGESGNFLFESENIEGLTEMEISWLINDKEVEDKSILRQTKNFAIEIPKNAERIYLKFTGIRAQNIYEFVVSFN